MKPMKTDAKEMMAYDFSNISEAENGMNNCYGTCDCNSDICDCNCDCDSDDCDCNNYCDNDN